MSTKSLLEEPRKKIVEKPDKVIEVRKVVFYADNNSRITKFCMLLENDKNERCFCPQAATEKILMANDKPITGSFFERLEPERSCLYINPSSEIDQKTESYLKSLGLNMTDIYIEPGASQIIGWYMTNRNSNYNKTYETRNFRYRKEQGELESALWWNTKKIALLPFALALDIVFFPLTPCAIANSPAGN
ncbi:MAG: hypothetical protein AB7S75_11550 [Desulfococcaceae bacterium]